MMFVALSFQVAIRFCEQEEGQLDFSRVLLSAT